MLIADASPLPRPLCAQNPPAARHPQIVQSEVISLDELERRFKDAIKDHHKGTNGYYHKDTPHLSEL